MAALRGSSVARAWKPRSSDGAPLASHSQAQTEGESLVDRTGSRAHASWLRQANMGLGPPQLGLAIPGRPNSAARGASCDLNLPDPDGGGSGTGGEPEEGARKRMR
jgi:hypothetical protein